MNDPCYVSIRMERELRTKARFMALYTSRTLAGYIRQLIKRDIRASVAGHGPIPPAAPAAEDKA